MQIKARQAGSAFVIATRNRADDLLRTVESLVAQTVLPTELCIVDSSDETPTAEAIAKVCSDAGIALDHHHPAPGGSRSSATSASSGPPATPSS